MLSENTLCWKRFAGGLEAYCIHLPVSFWVFEKTRADISLRPHLPAVRSVKEAQLWLKPLANAVR